MRRGLHRAASAVAIAAALSAGPVSPADAEPPTAQGPAAPARRDSVLNGLLVGAGIGFGAGFLGMAAFNARETASGPIWDGEALGIYTSVGLLGAAIGAGIGAAIDALHPDRQWTGRPRPVELAPILGARRRGLLLTIRR